MKTRKSVLWSLIAATATVTANPLRACERGGFATHRQTATVRYESPRFVQVQPCVVERPFVAGPSLVVEQPAVRESRVPEHRIALKPGATYQLAGRFLEKEPGVVSLNAGGITLECRVTQWSPTSVTFVVPSVLIREDLAGMVIVQRADGNSVSAIAIQLLAKPALAEVVPAVGAPAEQLSRPDEALSAVADTTVVAEK